MKRIACVAIPLIALSAACASTELVAHWKDPSVGHLTARKTIIFAPAGDASLRRTAEDELAAQLNARGVQAVASYTLFPDAVRPEDESVRERVKQLGFDCAVVMRVVSVTRDAVWMPGTWSGPYYAFYGWPSYQGYVTYDTYYRIETNVYRLPDERLVWASATRTVNPSGVRELVDDTARAVAKSMRKEGLL
jgi:hypothetical protein